MHNQWSGVRPSRSVQLGSAAVHLVSGCLEGPLGCLPEASNIRRIPPRSRWAAARCSACLPSSCAPCQQRPLQLTAHTACRLVFASSMSTNASAWIRSLAMASPDDPPAATARWSGQLQQHPPSAHCASVPLPHRWSAPSQLGSAPLASAARTSAWSPACAPDSQCSPRVQCAHSGGAVQRAIDSSVRALTAVHGLTPTPSHIADPG